MLFDIYCVKAVRATKCSTLHFIGHLLPAVPTACCEVLFDSWAYLKLNKSLFPSFQLLYYLMIWPAQTSSFGSSTLSIILKSMDSLLSYFTRSVLRGQ